MKSTPAGRLMVADVNLRIAVENALRARRGSVDQALDLFLRTNGREALHDYFELVAADMAGAALPGGGHMSIGSQRTRALARRPNDDDAGQCFGANHSASAGASSPSDGRTDHTCGVAHVAPVGSPSLSDGGAGQLRIGAHSPRARAPSPLRERADQSRIVTQSPGVRPARDPSPTQLRAVDAVKGAAADAIWRVKKTSDGRAWGEIGYHELAGLARDGGIAKALIDHIGAVNDKQRFAPLPTLVSAGTFETLCRNAERANV
ncbi:hypothetical protein [Rhodoplanes elegans]|uniref:hypothetical protein n=1 Tax=Rhodoplanes elegans TaxID=29408 RepID=UPI0011B9383E|nr:hypothetical protein [Rhodoplanes elegans]